MYCHREQQRWDINVGGLRKKCTQSGACTHDLLLASRMIYQLSKEVATENRKIVLWHIYKYGLLTYTTFFHLHT